MDLSNSLPQTTARIERERRTIQVMVGIYCHKQHGSAAGCLCDECAPLLAYALQRIEKCPFKEDKPTCRKCPVHCYKHRRLVSHRDAPQSSVWRGSAGSAPRAKDMREEIRRVMAFAGPWMLLYHPVLTVAHYWDEWKREQVIGNR